ncbi:uncharacterized protein METZ01_LOCUS47694 [marine metagenome]|uniref:Uncharacterized protein n=1 Tax=marine metagenome TaxID=408172 RepID=A0A381RSJ6_9ZZZZ
MPVLRQPLMSNGSDGWWLSLKPAYLMEIYNNFQLETSLLLL